jgi:CheY-like chemotaxis protein
MYWNNYKPTILVVEDFDDTRVMMRTLLEMEGYRIVEASNGREAVEVAAAEHPNLVLMDLNLPEMDGLEAVRRIRGIETLCDVPIIAVTAHSPELCYNRARSAGCNGLLTKPLDFDQLDELVQAWIDRSQGQGVLQTA